MDFVSLMADCGQRGRPFASNPDDVPSLRLADGRQLVCCRVCAEAANPARERGGPAPDPRAPTRLPSCGG